MAAADSSRHPHLDIFSSFFSVQAPVRASFPGCRGVTEQYFASSSGRLAGLRQVPNFAQPCKPGSHRPRPAAHRSCGSLSHRRCPQSRAAGAGPQSVRSARRCRPAYAGDPQPDPQLAVLWGRTFRRCCKKSFVVWSDCCGAPKKQSKFRECKMLSARRSKGNQRRRTSRWVCHSPASSLEFIKNFLSSPERWHTFLGTVSVPSTSNNAMMRFAEPLLCTAPLLVAILPTTSLWWRIPALARSSWALES